jgi:hypothetical protein
MIVDGSTCVLKEGNAAAGVRGVNAKDCDAKGAEKLVLSVSRSYACVSKTVGAFQEKVLTKWERSHMSLQIGVDRYTDRWTILVLVKAFRGRMRRDEVNW